MSFSVQWDKTTYLRVLLGELNDTKWEIWDLEIMKLA